MNVLLSSVLSTAALGELIMWTTGAASTGADLATLDAQCASEAATNMIGTGTGFALVSTNTIPACARLPDDIVKNTNGDTVANEFADFWENDGSFSTGLVGVPNFAADGSSTNVEVWTGTNIDGYSSGDHCRSWTSSLNGHRGTTGFNNLASAWVQVLTAACDNGHSFYCISGEPAEISAHASGDPHLVGFDGSKFDFGGIAGEVFNMISEPFIQVNTRLTALQVGSVNGTWMGEVGVKYSGHDIVVANSGDVLVDGRVISSVTGAFVDLSEDAFVEVNAGGNIANIVTPSYSIKTVLRKTESGNYFNTFFGLLQKPTNPHGVIGQTGSFVANDVEPRPVVSKVMNGLDILEGALEDYIVHDGVLGKDFTFNRYTAAEDKEVESKKRHEEFSVLESIIAH